MARRRTFIAQHFVSVCRAVAAFYASLFEVPSKCVDDFIINDRCTGLSVDAVTAAIIDLLYYVILIYVGERLSEIRAA